MSLNENVKSTPLSPLLADTLSASMGEQESDAASLSRAFEHLYGATVGSVSLSNPHAVPFVVLPKGRTVESLQPLIDALPKAPPRHKGTALLTSAASFIAHINRFKSDDDRTLVYAFGEFPKLPVFEVVYDHATNTSTAFEQWRAKYAMEYSAEFKVWFENANRWFKQSDFAQFLESRALELADGTEDSVLKELAARLDTTIGRPAEMLAQARRMAVKVDSVLHEAVVTSTGEISITYQEKHEASMAGVPIIVPTLFAIQVPVFVRGAQYLVPARVAYRRNDQRIEWSYSLYRPDALVQHIVTDVGNSITLETDVPVLLGTPRA